MRPPTTSSLLMTGAPEMKECGAAGTLHLDGVLHLESAILSAVTAAVTAAKV